MLPVQRERGRVAAVEKGLDVLLGALAAVIAAAVNVCARRRSDNVRAASARTQWNPAHHPRAPSARLRTVPNVAFGLHLSLKRLLKLCDFILPDPPGGLNPILCGRPNEARRTIMISGERHA